MIDRMVLYTPEKSFDFFNDFKDTMRYLQSMAKVARNEDDRRRIQRIADRLQERKENEETSP